MLQLGRGELSRFTVSTPGNCSVEFHGGKFQIVVGVLWVSFFTLTFRQKFDQNRGKSPTDGHLVLPDSTEDSLETRPGCP